MERPPRSGPMLRQVYAARSAESRGWEAVGSWPTMEVGRRARTRATSGSRDMVETSLGTTTCDGATAKVGGGRSARIRARADLGRAAAEDATVQIAAGAPRAADICRSMRGKRPIRESRSPASWTGAARCAATIRSVWPPAPRLGRLPHRSAPAGPGACAWDREAARPEEGCRTSRPCPDLGTTWRFDALYEDNVQIVSPHRRHDLDVCLSM